MPKLVAMREVSKVFADGTLALDHMSLDVQAGEFLSLLGPSGCGKSTALRLMAGLAEPSSGMVERPSEGGIGFVFQEPTLMPWQTVSGNVFLPLKLQGLRMGEARVRVMDGLESVGLADFAHSYPRQLSGGMRMRVSIARALVTRPSLLLMDEPFAALDEITRHKLNDDLLALWRRTGVTIVFVTHSVFESASLSSRIVVMQPRPGRVFKDLLISQPRERGADYRVSEAYRLNCQLVSETLEGAMGLGS